jgi:orotate phosphoribosyltransferase
MSMLSVLLESGALRFGNFTLKDGSASPLFINFGDIAMGKHLQELGEHFALGILRHYPETTCLFGPAYKGFTIATATAIALARRGLDIRVFFDRKEVKAHGEGGLFFGQTPTSQDRIVVLDDVTTSGATKIEAFDKIERAFAVRPLGVLVGVDRRRGTAATPFTMHALLTLTDIAEALRAEGRPEAALVQAYIEGAP